MQTYLDILCLLGGTACVAALWVVVVWAAIMAYDTWKGRRR